MSLGGTTSAASAATLDGFLREQLDVLVTLRDNMPAIRKVALHYTNVEELDDFRDQVDAVHAVLGTLLDASELILQASDAGITLLTAEDAAAQRAALGLGSAALMQAEELATAAGFQALQEEVALIQVNLAALTQGFGNYASKAALNSLTTRVTALESNTSLLELLDQLTRDLENGVYLPNWGQRILALEAQVAALQAGDGTGSGTNWSSQISAINNLLVLLDQRVTATQAAQTSLTVRVTQVETNGAAALQIQIELNARLSAAEGTLSGQATLLQELSTRTYQTEQGLLAEAQARLALQSLLDDTRAGLDALATAVQTLTTSVEIADGKATATSLAVTDLTSRITNAEQGLEAEATARETLMTRVTQSEYGIEATAVDMTELRASLIGAGNQLPNAGFEADLKGWTIFSRGPGWLTQELQHNMDPHQVPAGVNTMGLTNAGLPSGSIGVRSTDTLTVIGGKSYMVSAYLGIFYGKARLYWRFFNGAGQEIEYGLIGETQDPPTTSLASSTRLSKNIPAPVDAASIQLQWWISEASGSPLRAWLFRPMLEQVSPQQTSPSPWNPSASGLETAIATAVEIMEVRVAQTEEGLIAQAEKSVELETQLTLVPTTFVDSVAPTSPFLRTGDIWFNPNTGNQYVWDGGQWMLVNTGLRIYAQEEPPTGELVLGALWIDTNDGNKMRRWDGTQWVDVTDVRVQATANALQALTTEVQETQDTLSTQALSLTQLSASLEDTQGALDAVSDAQQQLSASVTQLAGSKAAVIVSPTMPTTGTRAVGDLWIDSDDGNAMHAWDGTQWVLRKDTTVRVFAQPEAPNSVGRMVGDLWFDTDNQNHQYRWNGSGWTDITDARITAQASQIANLQSQVSLLPTVYVQIDMPAGSSFAVGDIWFDSDDDNKQYIWDGSAWGSTSNISGASTYAQAFPPTGGAYKIGDLWVDTGNGNQLHRWDGVGWVNVSDNRLAGNASAINTLGTRVDGVEGSLQSQAESLTQLSSTVGTKNRTFIQGPQAPTATAVNDLWVDSSDNNKLYHWDGGTWVLKRLDAGVRTFATADPPASPNPGDLWIETDANNRLRRWNGGSWEDLSDARLQIQADAIEGLTTRTSSVEGQLQTQSESITQLNNTLSVQPKTYVQATAPPNPVVGDLWVDSANGNTLKSWNGTLWAVPFAQAERTVFAQDTAPNSSKLGDLWFDTNDGNRPYRWNGSAWVDNTDIRVTGTATAVQSLTTQVEQIDSTRVRTYVSDTVPTGGTYRDGDLWIQGNNNNLLHVRSGMSWIARPDTRARTSVSTTEPGQPAIGDIWFDSSMEYRQKRWSGSAWVDVADVRMTTQGNAITQLQGQLSGKADVSALNQLGFRIEEVDDRVDGHAYDITQLGVAVSGKASASVVQAIDVRVQSTEQGVAQANAAYTLYMDVNGYISGFTSTNNGPDTSRFEVNADVFKISKPGGGARTEYSNGNWRVYDANGVLRVRMGVW